MVVRQTWSKIFWAALTTALLISPRRVQCTLKFDPFNPTTVPIVESTKDIKKLTKVGCTESNNSKICTCLVRSSQDPFETWWLQGESSYMVYYDNTARLSAGTTYNLQVDCKSNNQGSAVTQTLKVEVTHNQPPVITNYNQDSVTVPGKTTKQYDPVYPVDYYDPEHDAVTFTMTQSPDLGHFLIGYGDGIVRANVDMRSASSDQYTLIITANNSYNLVKDFTLKVFISDKNSPPTFSNPSTVSVPETAKAGYVIMNLDVSDPDPYLSPSPPPVCRVVNANLQDKLILDMPNSQIRVAYDNALDYESSPLVEVDCSLSDGYLTGQMLLSIKVTDVNEPPVWSADNFFCSIDEGSAGASSCKLGASVYDPEGKSFTVDAVTTTNQKLFKYDQAQDLLKFSVDYDLDSGSLDSDLTVILTATDNKGLSSTATVKVHVNDINENKCQAESLKLFQLSYNDDLQALGSISASDKDATSPNNQLSFQVSAADPSTATDHILVTQDGQVYYTNLFSPQAGSSTNRLIVLCLDGGTPPTTSTTTVVVTYTVPTTPSYSTSLSTTTEKSIWEYEAFKAIFGTLMALAGIGLILLIASLLACCCARGGLCCYQRPPQPPVKPPSMQMTPYKTPTSRSLPPVEHLPEIEQLPPINERWENIAWSQAPAENFGPNPHLHHYH